MKHTLTYGVAGVVLLAGAIAGGGAWWLLAWPGVACLGVAVAYGGGGAAVFGKRPDGRQAWWARVLLFPYLLLTFAIWKLKRKISREDYYNEIVPGLWVGRRVLGSELPAGVRLIVDVAAEFAEPASTLAMADYRSFPILNYSAPTAEALQALANELRDYDGGLYIHCAQGHGRSATVAAAILLARGLAADPAAAEALVIKARPKVHLESSQQAALRDLTL